MRHRPGLLLVTVVNLLVAAAAGAQPVVSGFTQSIVASGLQSPTAMEFAPDGRLFVLEQPGRVRVIKDGVLLPTPFMSVNVSSSGERGMLGIAFAPDFATTRYVYLYYTATSPTVHNRVVRVRANGDVVEAGSEVALLDLPTVSATNHNGGAIHFGSDGKLYIAVGDNAVSQNSQSLNTPLGKMLRINADGTIPSDNPFYAQTTGINRAIWAMGLRNPFTFAFSATGTMYINDVGESSYEEINQGAAGANYGWPTTEGPTTDSRYVTPRSGYWHYQGTIRGCAITGGAFYTPVSARFPSGYAGDYFFADYCTGRIHHLDLATSAVSYFTAASTQGPVDLKVSDDGALYYVTNNSGNVYRIDYETSAPSISSHPQSLTVAPGSPASFSVTAAGATPLAYQWQRNGADMPGATAQTYTLAAAQATDNGARFRVRVTNSAGNALSNEAILTVTSNTAPVASIAQPAAGTLYSGGQSFTLTGSGSDPEDGALPASAFTWQVVFHHDDHTHPFFGPVSGSTSAAISIPRTGETSANVFYRVHLTVRDSQGATHTATRDLMPRTVSITVTTQPAGLGVTVDGQPRTAPYTFTGVVGMTRSIGAPSPQAMGGTTYSFGSWSDGGAATHDINTPAAATAYTATFQAGGGTAPPSGLVAAYAFAEASGTSVSDASGAGNHGTISGATRTTAGRFGAALSFDGVNDYVTIADSASLDLTTRMTLEAWVYPTASSGWRTVVLKEIPGELSYAIYSRDDAARASGWGYIGASPVSTASTSSVTLNAWTHLAVTYDGAALRLYRNGALESTRAISGSLVTSSNPLRIGGNLIWGEYFAGRIDEVRIYNRALTQAEIQSDMNTAIGGAPAPDTTPPAVSISAPAAGATVTGTTNVSATASDNVAVAGVQFFLDGAALGAEDTSAPFGVSWNTTGTANGTHSLTARARDAAGNAATSSAVAVQVSNTAPPPPPPPSGGLVAAYAFDEGTGSILTDRSGAGNHGNVSGAAWTAAGRYNGALSFDGIDDLVTIADSSSLDLTSALTIEAWVYPTTVSGWRTAVLKEVPGELSYGLYTSSQTSPASAWLRMGGTSRSVANPSALPLNTWTHLAMVYNGTSLLIYRNGVLQASTPMSGSITTSSSPLRLGGNLVWGEYYAGRLDDVRLYSRALTASEIQTDMNTAVRDP